MPAIAEPILHVDMDAFFVEVERRSDPSLRGVPVVVGGLGPRGVVASASYEARAAGVRSAMPMVEAKRRLPHGRFLAPDRGAYSAASRETFAILDEFTPAVEALSIDEAFVDIGGLGYHYADAAAVAAAVRAEIGRRLRLPASAGAATTKLVAKLASQHAKPNGQLVVPAGTELDFLHPLSVRWLWGVGEATFATIEGLGVSTVGELASLPRDLVSRRLGKAVGEHLWALAHNEDPRPVTPGSEPKTMSAEETFEVDLRSDTEIDRALFELCASLSRRLRKAAVATTTVTVKVRFADFDTVTRSHSLRGPVDLTSDLYAMAKVLVARAGIGGRPVRLLGVGAPSLTPTSGPRQLGLGDDVAQALAAASDGVRSRFGDDAVLPARLAQPPEGS